MVYNWAHGILLEAADEVSWDTDTMLLIATRFISNLPKKTRTRFGDYLASQVKEEKENGAQLS